MTDKELVEHLTLELDEVTKELGATKLALNSMLSLRARTSLTIECPECGAEVRTDEARAL